MVRLGNRGGWPCAGLAPHLLKDGECTGPLAGVPSRTRTRRTSSRSPSIRSPPSGMTVGEWRSVLYALLEGVGRLDISRDDIDGTLYPKPGRKISLVLFHTVPGGAGGALRIARSFPLVLETALGRMARCECGEETSCYGCLRNFATRHSTSNRGVETSCVPGTAGEIRRSRDGMRTGGGTAGIEDAMVRLG